MTSPMSNDELNRAIAEQAGWTLVPGQWRSPLYYQTGGSPVSTLPDFAHSIDAQKPVEKMLIDAGWTRAASGGRMYEAAWFPPRSLASYTAVADTEARARAEALLAALQVKNGEK